jgi:ketosteroid isomerase-like protein
MSQENVEIVRRGVEAWNRRDSAAWLLTYAAPDAEWSPGLGGAVEGTVYRGTDEIAKGLDWVWQGMDEFHFVESEVRDLGESVLWLGRAKMRGAASHVELDQEYALLHVWRDGKVVTVQGFLGWCEALKAVGLEE